MKMTPAATAIRDAVRSLEPAFGDAIRCAPSARGLRAVCARLSGSVGSPARFARDQLSSCKPDALRSRPARRRIERVRDGPGSPGSGSPGSGSPGLGFAGAGSGSPGRLGAGIAPAALGSGVAGAEQGDKPLRPGGSWHVPRPQPESFARMSPAGAVLSRSSAGRRVRRRNIAPNRPRHPDSGAFPPRGAFRARIHAAGPLWRLIPLPPGARPRCEPRRTTTAGRRPPNHARRGQSPTPSKRRLAPSKSLAANSPRTCHPGPPPPDRDPRPPRASSGSSDRITHPHDEGDRLSTSESRGRLPAAERQEAAREGSAGSSTAMATRSRPSAFAS